MAGAILIMRVGVGGMLSSLLGDTCETSYGTASTALQIKCHAAKQILAVLTLKKPLGNFGHIVQYFHQLPASE